jgi:hypothetical protein
LTRHSKTLTKPLKCGTSTGVSCGDTPRGPPRVREGTPQAIPQRNARGSPGGPSGDLRSRGSPQRTPQGAQWGIVWCSAQGTILKSFRNDFGGVAEGRPPNRQNMTPKLNPKQTTNRPPDRPPRSPLGRSLSMGSLLRILRGVHLDGGGPLRGPLGAPEVPGGASPGVQVDNPAWATPTLRATQ